METYNIPIKIKVLLILSCVFVSISNIVAFLNPANGLEMSVYNSTPLVVWAGIILCAIISFSLLAHQACRNCTSNISIYISGVLILLLSRISLLYVPFIRGYYTWRGDNLTHIGFLKDIFSNYHLSSYNYYPITHLLLAEISYVTNLSIETVVNYSTALISAFYVVSIYLISTIIFEGKKGRILSVALAGIVLFDTYNVYLMPNGWSIFYMPFVFYAYFKSFSNENIRVGYRFLLVFLLVLYPFFHPLSSLMMIFMFCMLATIGYILNYKSEDLRKYIKSVPSSGLLLEITILSIWILSFRRFHANFQNIFYSILKGGHFSALNQMTESLDKIDIHGFELLSLIFKMMGDEFIFLMFSFLAAFIILKNFNKNLHFHIVLLGSCTFMFGGLYAAYLFNLIPGLENIGTSRLVSYLMLFTPIYVAFTICSSQKKHRIISLFIILMVLLASFISILSLFPSPYITQPTSQVTFMTVSGVAWFSEYRNSEYSEITILTPTYRFADSILGFDASRDSFGSYDPIPNHFNYSQFDYLGASYDEDKYALITKLDTVLYDTVWKPVGRFTKNDFERMKLDISINKLYTNGEFDIHYVKSS